MLVGDFDDRFQQAPRHIGGGYLPDLGEAPVVGRRLALLINYQDGVERYVVNGAQQRLVKFAGLLRQLAFTDVADHVQEPRRYLGNWVPDGAQAGFDPNIVAVVLANTTLQHSLAATGTKLFDELGCPGLVVGMDQ